ncbi:DNA-formamidopyrimidine glycosylase [bacterium (Candidatus Gribaldobacteria) CG10_big_fil_rev_8_21_14_0_10_41_12]|uniref:DNA-formamidopyrimidine glycosylase n=1 Tax=bacterium (Candidatus Gribaldobacteria) CG10_big_fil_rev_8_21_14_0_10_41_12 TaxID=2014277 RepID=A0A2H0UW30_9BACT|nr:MAG: DNA-formamidopyrimidine glycosylase [bacterium (Candidatus Gribaldobacteria) CG10_big_fil_rev_8_21_14_0_10_41_12]
MPELPEVETIRQQLAKQIVGKELQGKKVIGVNRRAKILDIEFADKSHLIFHLKLTGQLIFNGTPGKHTRRVFNFNDGSCLIFNDVRKFGWYKIVSESQLKDIKKKLGPEPFGLTEKQFALMIAKKPKAKIKTLLMDQKFIAGIGNIYADEILFASRIHPLRVAGALGPREIILLLGKIKEILTAAIKAGGSSVSDYLDAFGQKGGYSRKHKVYQRTGQQCVKCGSIIERIRLAGRSAHYCPNCQK